MAAVHRQRMKAVRRLMAEKKVEAFLVTYLPNVRYLSGFTGSAAILCITPRGAWILTDFRYWEQAARQAPISPCIGSRAAASPRSCRSS
jgi:Xaa-Pro aminopeptidase